MNGITFWSTVIVIWILLGFLGSFIGEYNTRDCRDKFIFSLGGPATLCSSLVCWLLDIVLGFFWK